MNRLPIIIAMTVIKFPTLAERQERLDAHTDASLSNDSLAPVAPSAIADATLDWMPDEFAQYEDGTFAADEKTWQQMHAHFARYGFRIHRMAPLDSYTGGLQAISRVLSLVGYLRDYPDHYKIFSKGFTPDEHAYIRAVSNNDTVAAARLAPSTQFAYNIRDAMTVEGGCGLA